MFRRVDREFYLDNCSTTQAKNMFRNFFPCSSDEGVKEMEQMLETIEEPFSPAQFQGYLLLFKKSSSDALRNIQVFKDSLKKEVDEAEDNNDSGRASTTDSPKELTDFEGSKDNENTVNPLESNKKD